MSFREMLGISRTAEQLLTSDEGRAACNIEYSLLLLPLLLTSLSHFPVIITIALFLSSRFVTAG
jgi:hypothetical protein